VPALTITRPGSGTNGGPSHPKVALVGQARRRLVLPFAPVGSDIGGWSDSWSRAERPGRKPLTVYDADGLKTLAFQVLLAHRNHQTSVEPLLAQLKALAGDRLTILNASTFERGPWRMDTLTVTATHRQHGTNAITRASVALTFVEASDAAVRLGPVSGGKKGGKSKGKNKNPQKAQPHKVKKGDTLRKLATQFYGEPGEWRRIAKANGIKAHHLDDYIGKTITIPPDNDKKAAAAPGVDP
jgi:LysM repeat protein